MSNMKIVSMVGAAEVRQRADVVRDLSNLALSIADELMDIDRRLVKLRADVDKLKQQSIPQPAVHPSLSQDERSKLVDEQGGGS
jgi:hypothetical protein